MAKDTDGLNMPVLKTFLRNIKYGMMPYIKRLKYFSKCRFRKVVNKNVFYLIFEPGKKHPGLADRIKAIISCYDWAKMNGYQFKVYFETPFRLCEYLKPQFDWCCSLDEVEYSVFDTKFVEEHFRENPIELEKDKQYHCYTYDGHHMPRVFPDSNYRFSDLFHEMFEPCDEIKKMYLEYGIKEKSYVSCHFRFVNALEKFENTFFENHLETQEEREQLIHRCKKGLLKVIAENKDKDVYVFSDSKVFLDNIGDIPVKVLPHDDVCHVSEGAKDASTLKSFFDIFVMSKGSKVYRFCAPELYSISHYALLAATIGDLSFNDVNV